MATVYLSDGKPLQVQQLGIFELDAISPKVSGPFTYEVETLTGKKYEVEFDPDAFDEPPQKPDTPRHELVEKSAEWYDYLDWQLYQGAIKHKADKKAAIADYYEEVARYIKEHCIDPSQANRIVTGADWVAVYEAALVPQLSMEKIKEVLRSTYAAEFKGKGIFEVLSEDWIPRGAGTYNTLREWENRLMIQMKLTEVEYATLPLDERARKVCALFLSDIMKFLESEWRRKQDGKSSS